MPKGEFLEHNDSFSVDGIQLDRDNQEFMIALDYVLHTNKSIYLTGKAGSGKTTFLKYLRKVADKKMVVLAPTGVAAVNARGQTIHSFFHISQSLYVPNDKRLRTSAPKDDQIGTVYSNFRFNKEEREIIRNLELLVIDEVSMVRSDLLDVVDTLLRIYRKKSLPFGGVQVILIGDAFQLPPVVKEEERELLYHFYKSEYFFSAKVIEQNKPLYIELKKIYRQNEIDYINLLNRVRVNQLLDDDFLTLNRRFYRFVPTEETDNYIVLTTTNSRVNRVNDFKLAELTTPLRTYTADIERDFPLKSFPTDRELRLKVGAQVMFLKNIRERGTQRIIIYNGMIGTVTAANTNEVKVRFEAPYGGYMEHTVERHTWENVVYSWNKEEQRIEEKVIGTFRQFPLRLAWAITVHKSQGLTFNKVIADIGGAFAPGQVYVALSRCTSLNGLVLISPILPWSIKTDQRVLDFAKNETPETLLTEQLSGNKADFYYLEARKALHARKAGEMLENFFAALKYRNDITTDIFRRYVSVWATRLFKNISEQAEMIERLKDSINALNSQIDSMKQSLNNKETVIKEKDDELLSANTILNMKLGEIKAVNEKVKKLEKQVSEHVETTEGLEDTIKALNTHIDSLKESVKANEATIVNKDAELVSIKESLTEKQGELRAANEKVEMLDAQNKVQREEIARVSSITWYQKLFGKK